MECEQVMGPRQKTFSEKNKAKILKIGKAAARLFNKKGYLETNMDDIAGAARMSKGGIYHYFQSKDELLFFVLDNYMDTILKDLESELEQIEGGSTKIQFIISRHIELYTKHSAESKSLLHEKHCLPSKYYEIIAGKERQYYRIVSRAISQFLGTESGLGKAHITVMTFLLLGMCNWIYSWYNPKGIIGPQELSHTIWSVFMKGAKGYRN